jgi:glycosyltransferase involved in cell wall biosynthesis
MRITYLINGLNGGGAAFPMMQVIALMRELGHDVEVLAHMPQDGKAGKRLQDAGIPFQVLGESASDFLRQAKALVRHLRARRPDLIWTSLTRGTLYGQLIGGAMGIPVVSWQHSDYLKPGNLAALRLTRRLTCRWVADSDSVRTFVRERLGVPASRIETWPPFICNPASPTASAWQREGYATFRFGTLGRLHHSKQYGVLLRAYARAHQLDPTLAERTELVLGGDGPEQDALIGLAAELGITHATRFVGFVDRPADFLASLHGYVQTSLKEGFCIAVHEAMQAALPVVTTRVGQPAVSVRPSRTGWVCDVGDIDALANAMVALAGDPGAAANMGRAGRIFVLERYSRANFRSVGERLIQDIERQLGLAVPGPAAPQSPA